MNWKAWLLLLIIIPVSGFIIWMFSLSVMPPSEDDSPKIVDASESVTLDKPLVSFVDPWKGSELPRVTVIEYGNYACPICRETSKVINQLLNEHDDIRFVWKDLPSDLYTGSDIAAEAAQCAKDQGLFWEYQDTLFERNELFNHTSLTLIADDIGLDIDQFGKCLSDRDKKFLVEKSTNEAVSLDIDATPFFYINDTRYSGHLSYDKFEEIISSL